MKRRRWCFLVIGLLIGMGFVTYKADQLGIYHFGPARLRFDSEVWKQARSFRNNDPRDAMLRDVLTNVLHSGMGEADVRRLLGKPDDDEAGQDLKKYLRESAKLGSDYDRLFGYLIRIDSPFFESDTVYLRILFREGKAVKFWESTEWP